MVVFGLSPETFEFGEGEKKLCIVCCLHGDEQDSLIVLDYLKKLKLNVRVKVVIANPQAVKLNVRFIDSDLNRVFPGKQFGNCEEVLASKVLKEVEDYEYVLDLHSTSNDSPAFGITISDSREHLNFFSLTGVDKLVYMTPELASGRSLIDNCKLGISVELGKKGTEDSKINCENLLNNLLINLDIIDGIKETGDFKLFKTHDFVKPLSINAKCILSNFEYVRTGQVVACSDNFELKSKKSFFPILIGESSYDFMFISVKEVVNNDGEKVQT